VERRSAVDLALGVAVDGPVARLALIETGNGAHGVIDESVVDLAEDPIARLTETVVGTSRSLSDQFHRLVATRLCWSDQDLANQLRQVLDDSGVQNVAVLSDSEAATAMSSLPLAVPDDPDFVGACAADRPVFLAARRPNHGVSRSADDRSVHGRRGRDEGRGFGIAVGVLDGGRRLRTAPDGIRRR
jgi:hypothetical protein